MANINVYEFIGIVLGILGALGTLIVYFIKRQDDWTVTKINEHITVHNNDEKAHLAAIKLVAEILLKHNDDPKAHVNSMFNSEFKDLQIHLATTLANISNKLDYVSTELINLKSAHEEAIKAGLCFYQSVAKATHERHLKSDTNSAIYKDIQEAMLDNIVEEK